MNSIQKELVHKLKCIELNIGKPEDTQRTVALAWMEIEILSQELGNLLAIIHRDGGHHTDAVGEKQSVEDAHKVWADLMTENERLRAALRDARECIEAWAGYASEYFREKHGLAGDLARIDAALAAQPAPSGWRPIETAPREPGKYLLGWNGHHCGVIQYWGRKYEEDPEWVDEHTEFIDPPISHWMPLPPAPGKEEA